MTLEAIDIEVRFQGVVALQNVSLSVQPGLVTAVIGPNGSGKSTLFNSITGFVGLHDGRVTLDGMDLKGLPPHRRIARGIGRTFQTPRFDPATRVLDAVICGYFPVRRGSLAATLLGLPSSLRQEARLREQGHLLLDDLGLAAFAEHQLAELPMGHLRLVEVARAVANKPKYILLDEPAAGLSRAEQDRLSEALRRLAAGGVGVLLVEHNFGLVRRLADEVLVLDRGRELCRGPGASIDRDQRVIDIYLGASGMVAA
jgi:ABC-type branched-subunit amino acid transport system ATPase component